MTARLLVGDVFDGLATLEDGSVDLVITSPPFLALRSYLPADHPDKGKEIGSESTPAEFLDVMLKVTAELRRVLAPHGSICVELGDTYAGSGGAGGDYAEGGWKDGQEGYRQHGRIDGRIYDPKHGNAGIWNLNGKVQGGGQGWPLAKSKTLIPQLYEIALAYGFNPLTGQSSPAGQWRVRNVVTWARPNPPVGALGDKWRPATSDVVVACTSGKRYWDDLATRRPPSAASLRNEGTNVPTYRPRYADMDNSEVPEVLPYVASSVGGAPLLDYWEIPPGGYKGSHYAVFPEELVVPLVKAMCPEKVCRVCGEPSRRITQPTEEYQSSRSGVDFFGTNDREQGLQGQRLNGRPNATFDTLGFTDCGHDDYRPGLVLDPFAGSGTTLAVATGHGHDAVGIDLDERNADLARERVGPFFFEEVRV